MKKISVLFVCAVILLFFTACQGDVQFTQTNSQTVETKDGTEYKLLGNEWDYCVFGDIDFIGSVSGEKGSFFQLGSKAKTGMYCVDGEKRCFDKIFA